MSFGISLNKSFTSHKKLKRCYIISTLMNSCVYACVVRVCMYVRMRERENKCNHVPHDRPCHIDYGSKSKLIYKYLLNLLKASSMQNLILLFSTCNTFNIQEKQALAQITLESVKAEIMELRPSRCVMQQENKI